MLLLSVPEYVVKKVLMDARLTYLIYLIIYFMSSRVPVKYFSKAVGCILFLLITDMIFYLIFLVVYTL